MIFFRENKSWGITAKHPDVWKFPKVLKEGEKFDRKSTAVKTKTILGYDNHTLKDLLSQKKRERDRERERERERPRDLNVIYWMLTKLLFFMMSNTNGGLNLYDFKQSETNCV